MIFKTINSKILSVLLVTILISISTFQTINIISIKGNVYLSVIYFSFILTILGILFNIFITYIYNLIIFKFITGNSINNKIIFINFLLIEICCGFFYKEFMIKLIGINNNYFTIALYILNPFLVLIEYLFYRTLVKYEEVNKKEHLILYILLNFLIPIIFSIFF